ncbi:MAG: 50S ribosomal protein L23 [Microgenomates group bacterium GW2011_GWC1_43_13]|uniref:50S ribosomal protein L23 n=3 Tax=Candidatus Woeseibacteriota TaxID=1752722 RepID=A0A837IAH9_9BACT|nr:MAG: 50S ribosomal protein L23 [Microgenomates group bacterium GW2011_GWC1_43_13]KKT33538.1 MAG: 50S ribosomal protein L23 [Candidatus Woesebacteria bacterium GW2011_GWB1_44_11]KKT55027.1 MAG: 50S ribosomal protein L23 [Candidatus Woesebacteria bacterium GW2011_GWA1_44_23]OGM76753.1 MAG: 50S ribosomal protein L23 [Candidatus Woesebacteria bacterium RIFOXYA1_FULL_43_16]OGM83268.1 MAG: 50S ribosomal protein L23 [Candidatus Woesebacteria bacterium RIFOXYB1_FULL_42_36]OGM85057.1 MAG: 50S riboso
MIKPIFTEKSLKAAKLGNYTFRVEPRMDKKKIAAEVAEIFGVTVTGVRTIKTGGEKGRNARGRNFSVKASKKAIITLKEGEKIDIFEEGKK